MGPIWARLGRVSGVLPRLRPVCYGLCQWRLSPPTWLWCSWSLSAMVSLGSAGLAASAVERRRWCPRDCGGAGWWAVGVVEPPVGPGLWV